MKKKVAIAYGITGSYTDILANVLVGLVKHSKKFWDDVVVFHQGITEEQQQNLNKITKCRFIELETKAFLKYINEEQIKLYSVATFFRFESFSLLDEYEKVIWSDVDVLYQKDISGLAKFGDKSGYAATYAPSEYKVENNFYELINDYDMFTPMINAGLFVISNKLKNYREIQQWCYNSCVKYGSNLRWLDQAILNILIQEFNIEVEPIDLYQYHCHPSFEKYRKNAVIVHAHGLRKFWNDMEFQGLFPEWYDNNKAWLKLYPHKLPEMIYDFQPLVSVVMSVYERYDYLVDAVASILNQTYKNFELIIVVEKSKNQDKINKILNKIKDKRIVIINNKEKLGFSNSLNVGIEAAKGIYIARMDDDDISVKTRFMKEVQFMEDNKEIGICDSNAEFFMNASGYWYYTCPTSEEIKTLLLVTNPICHPSVMMRKSMLDMYNLRYDPEYFSEDYELWSRAAQYFPIAHIDEILLKYRASNKNITSTESSNEKIQNSIKKTIDHQFRDNLGLVFNKNELELLQRRIDIIGRIACRESAIKLQIELYRKIREQNKKVNYYDQGLLDTLFTSPYEQYQSINKKKIGIKGAVKRIFRPLYVPFFRAMENRIYGIIKYQSDYTNHKIDVLEYNIKNAKKGGK